MYLKIVAVLRHSGYNILTDLFFLPTCQNSSLRIRIKLILVHKEKLLLWVLGGKYNLVANDNHFMYQTNIHQIDEGPIGERVQSVTN